MIVAKINNSGSFSWEYFHWLLSEQPYPVDKKRALMDIILMQW